MSEIPVAEPGVIASLVSYIAKPEAYFITGKSSSSANAPNSISIEQRQGKPSQPTEEYTLTDQRARRANPDPDS